MANTTSAKKMTRASERKRLFNRPVRSSMRTAIAQAREAIAEDSAAAAESIRLAVTALDKASKRGVIHDNAASRRKSRLMKQHNQAQAGTAEATPVKPKAKAAPKATAKTAKKPAEAKAKTATKAKPAAKAKASTTTARKKA